MITFKVEVEQEEDGRWLAEVLELPRRVDAEPMPDQL